MSERRAAAPGFLFYFFCFAFVLFVCSRLKSKQPTNNKFPFPAHANFNHIRTTRGCPPGAAVIKTHIWFRFGETLPLTRICRDPHLVQPRTSRPHPNWRNLRTQLNSANPTWGQSRQRRTEAKQRAKRTQAGPTAAAPDSRMTAAVMWASWGLFAPRASPLVACCNT